MLKKLINRIKFFYNIKFRFDLPAKKKLVLYDEINSSIIKKILKIDLNILPIRKREIYFWIFIKQVMYLDFSFKTYIINYLKFTSAKIFITLIDNDLNFYKLKSHLKNIFFISIQNGNRMSHTSMFRKKKYFKSKRLHCDHMLVFNKYYISQYQKIINSKYHVIGNYKNNMVKINKIKYKKSFLYISHYNKNYAYRPSILKSLNLIDLYFLKKNKKINILLKSKTLINQKNEINYYKKIFKSKYSFHLSTSKNKSQNILDKFENIISSDSTLGYEALSRKKKIIIFPLSKKKVFGWPAPYKKIYDFFCSKKLIYTEIERVLNNVYNCTNSKWKKNYYEAIKDQMIIDKNNTILKKLIRNILNN